MRILPLFWQLMRYRVAVMLILFMFLSVSLRASLDAQPWALIVASLALAFSYVSATSLNDLADEKIDKINHPHSSGRPLVNNKATTRDMWTVFGSASLITVILASLVSVWALATMLLSLLINVLYSLSPFRVSYRTFLAPLFLGTAYVGVPYLLGIAVAQSELQLYDSFWLLGLYTMFVGRIILKDFRDRKGDSKYNKPTFLLKFGKNATCAVSFVMILVGGIILFFINLQEIWLSLIIAAYTLSILFMLGVLQRSTAGEKEQLAIGIGAKMGNGLLITLLCAFALHGNVSVSNRISVTLLVTAIFFVNYTAFLASPKAAVNNYRG